MGLSSRQSLAAGAALLLAAAALQAEGRYDAFCRKAAQGADKLACVAATYFGADGDEEFVSVGTRRDGTMVAFGNAWGPGFPSSPAPTVVGKGEWYEVSAYPGGRRLSPTGEVLDPAADYPNRCGFMVYYAAGLRRIERVVKFDWAVATISAAAVLGDDSIILTGSCSQHFRALAKQAKVLKLQPNPDPGDRRGWGPVYYDGVMLSGDAYVAKLSADAATLEWVWIFEGHRAGSPQVWPLDGGAVGVLIARRPFHVSADGAAIEGFPAPGGKFLCFDRVTGGFLRGGDHNSGTGREPWRKPIFWYYGPDGQCKWKLWNWDSHLVGHDDFRLVSDSSTKNAAVDADGNLLVSMWSDGGNSVMTRHPIDLERPVGHEGFGMSAWGAGVLSLAYLTRIDPKTFDVLGWTTWCGYYPCPAGRQDFPSGARINGLIGLPDGSVAFHGLGGTGLIQTPGCWGPYEIPLNRRPIRYSGQFLAVFSKDFANLRFCSYTPGCTLAGLAPAAGGAAAVGYSWGSDEHRPDARRSPTVNAVQPTHGGGRWDAHIILLGKPD